MKILTKQCQNCGSSYTSKKDTSKYCSDACKQDAFRKRHNIEQPSFLKSNDNELGKTPLSVNTTPKKQEVSKLPTLQKIPNQQYNSLNSSLNGVSEKERLLTQQKEALLFEYNRLLNENVVRQSQALMTIIGGSLGAFSTNSKDTTASQFGKIFLGGVIGFMAGTLIGEYQLTASEERKYNEIRNILNRIMSLDLELNNLKVQTINLQGVLKRTPKYEKVVEISYEPKLQVESKKEIPIQSISLPITPQRERKQSLTGIINSKDLLDMQFPTWEFKDKWLNFFGKPALSFKCLIYGSSGAGKSTFAIQFAEYLANNLGRVLYISSEEGLSHTLKDKLRRTEGANSAYLDIAEYKNFEEIKSGIKESKYPFIFIDSINNVKMTPQQLEELSMENPQRSFISIFQATKKGDMKGSSEYIHNADISVKVADKEAAIEKNRFALKESEKMLVFA